LFDNIVSRRYTNCAKWDEIIDEYGIEDLIPLTVADMDYRIAPEIVNVVIDAANHGIYGYTNVSEKYIEQFKRLEEKFEVTVMNIEKKEAFLNVFSRNVNVVGITDKRVVNGILSKVEVTE